MKECERRLLSIIYQLSPSALSAAGTLHGLKLRDLLPVPSSVSDAVAVSRISDVSLLISVEDDVEDMEAAPATTLLVRGGVQGTLLGTLPTPARVSAWRCSGEGDRSIDHLGTYSQARRTFHCISSIPRKTGRSPHWQF